MCVCVCVFPFVCVSNLALFVAGLAFVLPPVISQSFVWAFRSVRGGIRIYGSVKNIKNRDRGRSNHSQRHRAWCGEPNRQRNNSRVMDSGEKLLQFETLDKFMFNLAHPKPETNLEMERAHECFF